MTNPGKDEGWAGVEGGHLVGPRARRRGEATVPTEDVNAHKLTEHGLSAPKQLKLEYTEVQKILEEENHIRSLKLKLSNRSQEG